MPSAIEISRREATKLLRVKNELLAQEAARVHAQGKIIADERIKAAKDQQGRAEETKRFRAQENIKVLK